MPIRHAGRYCCGKKLKCVDMVAMVLSLAGAILMMALGATILREYLLAKSFSPATCTVQSVKMNAKNDTRTCRYCARKRCWDAAFPCVYVRVNYTIAGSESRGKGGLLHQDVIQLRGTNPDCSMESCDESVTHNFEEAANFAQKYMSYKHDRTQFTCFYSPDYEWEVIVIKKYNFHAALHSMCWSSVAFVGFGALFIYRVRTGKAFESNPQSLY